jgi:hypothetical protein
MSELLGTIAMCGLYTIFGIIIGLTIGEWAWKR